MEQRRLRLGDTLDDYCPRERRVTNHAIVAMVEEDVKQTRCTTCDAEHVYKGGKAPRRKKVEATGKLYKQVLAGLTDDPAAAAVSSSEPEPPETIEAEPEIAFEPVVAAVVVEDIAVVAAPVVTPDAIADVLAEEIPDDSAEENDEAPSFIEDGPVHRPLIRAQLPRVEGVKLERQAPDFTIRQANGRGHDKFRGHGGGNGSGNGGSGQRFGRGPQRGGGGGGGRGGGGGNGQGFGRSSNGSQQRFGGPRKRGR